MSRATVSAAAARSSRWHQLQPLLLLATGTSVALQGQHVNNLAKIDASVQLLTLARYVFAFALSALLISSSSSSSSGSSGRATRLPRSTQVLLVTMGLLDLACYQLFNLGFGAVGSAVAAVVLAAAGQICTALLSVTLLRRKLRAQHVAAVAVVTGGLLLRALDDVLVAGPGAAGAGGGSKRAGWQLDVHQAYGIGCVFVSALLYSILGCLYEALMNRDSGRVSGEQASFTITGVSLAASLLHQASYTLPNVRRLVLEPVAASAAGPRGVAIAHLIYGVITAAHQTVQVRLLRSHGALTVGLVNAVRASMVSVVGSLLFCAAQQHLCLTPARAASALVVTAGAALWVLAGKPGVSTVCEKAE